MQTEGHWIPATTDAVRTRFEEFRPTAEELVSNLSRQFGVTPDESTTDAAVRTAQEIVFAGLLTVYTGSRADFEEWLEDREEGVTEFGSDNVEFVAWHPAPAQDTIVATTYQNERRAAIQTLRRQAMGECYDEVL